ncbi:MAG: GntR family transcriptional regulator [Lachnospiraceae bacterium]|nr:GntR family transcriptional regulator [Lachnospiraceae bacterium]
MIQLNYRDTRPIYEQIKDSFSRLIISGGMSADEKLPSVRTLASELSINPNTIQRAYNELEAEGFVYSVPGKGSFVNGEKKEDGRRVEELKRQMRNTVSELFFMGATEEELIRIVKEEGEKK